MTPLQSHPAAWLLVAACVANGACVHGTRRLRGGADDPEGTQALVRPNVAAARELDQEGVRRFREGRYADAMRYFQAAHRLGGPSSELWNIARSLEKLDDPQAACTAIDEYLAQHNLSAQDRGEAERESRMLQARPSLLTVTTTPAGAFVTIDGGQVAGPTPVSVEILPGRHAIAVRREGHASDTRSVEARFGRAIIVSLDLAPARK